MLRPISKTVAKKAIKFHEWSYGIVNGIKELHSHRLKIAHLDIRLPKCMLQTRRHTCVDRIR